MEDEKEEDTIVLGFATPLYPRNWRQVTLLGMTLARKLNLEGINSRKLPLSSNRLSQARNDSAIVVVVLGSSHEANAGGSCEEGCSCTPWNLDHRGTIHWRLERGADGGGETVSKDASYTWTYIVEQVYGSAC